MSTSFRRVASGLAGARLLSRATPLASFALPPYAPGARHVPGGASWARRLPVVVLALAMHAALLLSLRPSLLGGGSAAPVAHSLTVRFVPPQTTAADVAEPAMSPVSAAKADKSMPSRPVVGTIDQTPMPSFAVGQSVP